MLPGEFDIAHQRCFTRFEIHLKLLECVVDGTWEVVLEVRRLQKTDISSYQAKRNRRVHSSAGRQISFLLPQGKQISRKTVARHLNPIENVWEALGRQVAGRNYPPTNKNTLIRARTEEWDKLPQQLLDNVVSKYGMMC
ncbi:hypothetical protein TNCV_3676151 [Trichonephila clavipes]|nr:hypothetical protein TNCV_3676151 [Trichonephila clavipes]